MKNPIPYSSMFAAPESTDELCAYIEGMNGSEKAIAYTIAMMTFNLCHDLVKKEIEETV
jgi:hypothetical protein